MTTLSAVIKKELKQAFPGIKFSVTTSRMESISVKWELEIGTTATKNAVSEICKRHETVEHHGDVMNDTSWYSGISVYVNPTYTQERKDWAVKATEARNFVGTVWNETNRRFEEADGRDAFHATKQYREYCDNGVTSGLVDEYGQEPNAKRWYYERLAKEALIETPATEQKTIEPELVESPEGIIIPIAIQAITTKISIKSNFPADIKKRCVDEYRSQAEREGEAKITKLIELAPTDYQKFTSALLERHVWLAGEGGNKTRSHYYNTCVAVTNGTDYVLIDPQGLDYARCLGFGVGVTLKEILNLAKIQLSSAVAQPETIESEIEAPTLNSLVTTDRYRIKVTDVRTETVTGQLLDDRDNLILEYRHPVYVCIRKSEILSSSEHQPEPETIAPTEPETNLIPFPSPKQSEPQHIVQPQSNDGNSFYLQSYQAWVNKLVARGEYAKIKSFDEWYAIAVEVM